jgi:hypothetical protein
LLLRKVERERCEAPYVYNGFRVWGLAYIMLGPTRFFRRIHGDVWDGWDFIQEVVERSGVHTTRGCEVVRDQVTCPTCYEGAVERVPAALSFFFSQGTAEAGCVCAQISSRACWRAKRRVQCDRLSGLGVRGRRERRPDVLPARSRHASSRTCVQSAWHCVSWAWPSVVRTRRDKSPFVALLRGGGGGATGVCCASGERNSLAVGGGAFCVEERPPPRSVFSTECVLCGTAAQYRVPAIREEEEGGAWASAGRRE